MTTLALHGGWLRLLLPSWLRPRSRAGAPPMSARGRGVEWSRRPAFATRAASGEGVAASRRGGEELFRERRDLAERVSAFLRERHPLMTPHKVEDQTGIAARTVVHWLLGNSAPSGWAMLRLAAVYGPEFLCAVLTNPPSWLDAAAQAEEQRRLREDFDRLRARLDRIAP